MSDASLAARMKELELILGKKVGFSEPPEENKSAEATDLDSGEGGSNENKQLTEELPSGYAVTPVPVASQQQQQPGTPSPQKVKTTAKKPTPKSETDWSSFFVGQSLSKNVEFCPWTEIQGYPDRFIGKTNKPRARPFFDKILEGRVWNFFYLHDVENPTSKPHLLVPTEEFEFFLFDINFALNIGLTIPGPPNWKRFCKTFGEGGTPQPRYLKQTTDQKTLEVEEWPEIAEGDVAGFEAATAAEQSDWLSKMNTMQAGHDRSNREGEARERAAMRQQDRLQMLHDAHQYLDPSSGHDNLVLICMDVEAIEVSPNPVSEVGLAILDLALVSDTPPGPSGRSWWPSIKACHLRTKEYAGLVNYRFVEGCPDAFDFGISTFPEAESMPLAINAILMPYIEQGRDLIFVGHDGKQDLRLLSSIGFHALKLPRLLGSLDAQTMHQAWRNLDNGRGLSAVLSDVCIPSQNLHNAGNDAVYTLRAMIAVAFEAKRKWECDDQGTGCVPSLWMASF